MEHWDRVSLCCYASAGVEDRDLDLGLPDSERPVSASSVKEQIWTHSFSAWWRFSKEPSGIFCNPGRHLVTQAKGEDQKKVGEGRRALDVNGGVDEQGQAGQKRNMKPTTDFYCLEIYLRVSLR